MTTVARPAVAVATAVTVTRVEGWAGETDRPVTVTGPGVFAAADRVIQDMAYTAPHPGQGYHKTDVTVTFDDGTSYRTCYLLTFHGHQSLADHIREESAFLSAHGGDLGMDLHLDTYFDTHSIVG